MWIFGSLKSSVQTFKARSINSNQRDLINPNMTSSVVFKALWCS